jgi:hypothetical protein
MVFDFSACRSKILDAVMDQLREQSNYIVGIEEGVNRISGLSLDIAPWNGHLSLSLRLADDFPLGQRENRYSPVEWRHFDFTRDCDSVVLRNAGQYVQGIYLTSEQNLAKGIRAVHVAHLIFLAAAEALISPAVAMHLQGLGVNAEAWENDFAPGAFEYIVVDPDQTIKANYCELVLANRVTARWL